MLVLNAPFYVAVPLTKCAPGRAEHLVPSHTRPVQGAAKIADLLTDYRDAVQLVHDQTVRWINQDLHPEDIATRVRLTPELQRNAYLKVTNYAEFFFFKGNTECCFETGNVRHFAVVCKGLFAGYMGWFSGDVTELNPFHAVRCSEKIDSTSWKRGSLFVCSRKGL